MSLNDSYKDGKKGREVTGWSLKRKTLYKEILKRQKRPYRYIGKERWLARTEHTNS